MVGNLLISLLEKITSSASVVTQIAQLNVSGI